MIDLCYISEPAKWLHTKRALTTNAEKREMAVKPLPSLEYLNQCFVYDAVNGTLTWKVRPREHFPREHNCRRWNKMFAGKPVGSKNHSGYYVTRLKTQSLQVHRLVWVIANQSQIPEGMIIDHKDGDASNNRLSNLRIANFPQNNRNARLRSDNTAKLKGVKIHRYNSRCVYEARIRVDKKLIYLGCFNTPEEAHAAYVDAAKKYFGDFARAS